MAASNQNGAGGTCAGMGNGAWPEIDVEGSGIMVDPPSTGADTVVVGVSTMWWEVPATTLATFPTTKRGL